MQMKLSKDEVIWLLSIMIAYNTNLEYKFFFRVSGIKSNRPNYLKIGQSNTTSSTFFVLFDKLNRLCVAQIFV